MEKTLVAALAGAVIAVSAPIVPALAHHSHAMFEPSREVTVTGTVSAVRLPIPTFFCCSKL